MKFRGSIIAATAAVLLGSASAQAADLYGGRGGSIKDGYAAPEMSRPVSWYMRGDVGFAWQNLRTVEEKPAYSLSDTHIDDTKSFGFGLGYYFSKNVRGDLTFDWRRDASVSGVLNDGAATVQGQRDFNVKNMLMLANVYYDFDTRSRFTPYIGAGLGFSRNTTSAGGITITGCDTGPTGAANCSAAFEGTTKTSAAGALMAGFTAQLHSRVALDVGYRFLYLGDAKTGDAQITRVVPDPLAPSSVAGPSIHDMTAHEVRVGMRVDLR